MHYMCNKYNEKEDLRKTRNEKKSIFSLFYDDPIEHDKFQKVRSVEGVPAINQAVYFNIVSMIKGVAEL